MKNSRYLLCTILVILSMLITNIALAASWEYVLTGTYGDKYFDKDTIRFVFENNKINYNKIEVSTMTKITSIQSAEEMTKDILDYCRKTGVPVYNEKSLVFKVLTLEQYNGFERKRISLNEWYYTSDGKIIASVIPRTGWSPMPPGTNGEKLSEAITKYVKLNWAKVVANSGNAKRSPYAP